MDAALMEEHFGPRDELELDLLLEAIFRHYHYDFRGYSRGSLHRRLARAQHQHGCDSLSQLQHLLLRDPAVFADLMGFLTIQVSEMFRDPAYFRALREQVVPHLKTYPSLKVWIAGCANGEEFYSLAILFREEGLEDRTIFYCTDISPAALEKAEAGIYAIDRLPQFSENHRLAGGKASLSDYYTAAYGAAVFDKTLRRRAVFAQHNLASDQVFGEVQLVSSRNVLIYFDRELQDRALGLFGESLVRGGFLGLGSKETLRFSRYSDGFADFDEGEKIYRRNLQDLKALDHAA
ncbi:MULTISPECIES: CheR family methyltransferase [Sphingobium]|jgi:chemotaxis protein methyltransferase CheR|uniref:Chemotaxis protein CheR n=1 Tax=Sphingobium yanoikuyae TaxID=13690 RepID=A0A0J9D322_SPHYA|nr:MULTISPECIES: CheR family methyltransferase [Sphingobium]RSU74960.1 protein-glutamate O-methyltransferase CheR [Sphingomonas sp. S-NIH.Pt3_0716]ATI79181.1 chemotaxis protein CheR [Sphingobium yanoikuyae]ATP18850.1 chemotaxis protein CheR [Sphingobium yanoikuyae]KMW31748.1 chemotaxis protein CheR [Sphingobium yanoikuyae]MBR2268166.1 protein-glutamate O-methyltransferase CheR [Sphingobium sp.]